MHVVAVIDLVGKRRSPRPACTSRKITNKWLRDGIFFAQRRLPNSERNITWNRPPAFAKLRRVNRSRQSAPYCPQLPSYIKVSRRACGKRTKRPDAPVGLNRSPSFERSIPPLLVTSPRSPIRVRSGSITLLRLWPHGCCCASRVRSSASCAGGCRQARRNKRRASAVCRLRISS